MRKTRPRPVVLELTPDLEYAAPEVTLMVQSPVVLTYNGSYGYSGLDRGMERAFLEWE